MKSPYFPVNFAVSLRRSEKIVCKLEKKKKWLSGVGGDDKVKEDV